LHQAKVLGFCLKNGQARIHPGLPRTIDLQKILDSTALIKSFLGLTNFFRGLIWDYATLAAPLQYLCSTYKGGELPEEALVAFHKLAVILHSSPVMALPLSDRQYAVIVDASTGTADTPWGLEAILAQIDPQSEKRFYALCYASRELNKNQQQNSPFLLEMAAAVWAI